MYDKNYMLTHDIDWFCIINGVYVHVASAGGDLPERMRDREELRQLQYNVNRAEYIFNENEIEYNEQFLSARFQNYEGRSDYIKTFTEMARKGFVSLDRTNWNNPDDNTYHIVCRPPRKNQDNIQLDINGLQKYQINKNDCKQNVIEQVKYLTENMEK